MEHLHREKPRRVTSRGGLPSILFLGWLAGAILPGTSPLLAVVVGTDFTTLTFEELGSIRIPMVIGASKHEQKITDAPSSVTIVTRQDIGEYGYRTLADIMNGVRGAFVTSDRAYHFVGIRGVNTPGDFGGRVLLNVNGHRLNDPIYDSTLLGYDMPVDVDLIERVEVIRGPGSSLYGNNAFFGIINIITRQGDDIVGHGVEASGSYGGFGSYSGRFSVRNKLGNGVKVLLSGTYYQSDGDSAVLFPASESFSGAEVRDHDGEKARNFFASVSYGDLTLEGSYGRRDKQLPNGPYGADFHDKRNKHWDERAYVELRYSRKLERDSRMLVRTYVDHYAYDGTFAFDYEDPENPGLTVNRDTPSAVWAGTEIQLSSTLWEKHHVTFGVEGRYDFRQHQQNFDLNPAITYLNASENPESIGAYVQDEYRVLKNLTVNAGLRYDYFSTFGSTVNPRSGVIYHPTTSSTLKALYGQAYRAPNAYEFDFESPYYVANHLLKPETIRSYELVWEQSFARHYRFTGTAFYNQVEDLITQETYEPDPSRRIFSNTYSVDVKGAGAELEANWGNGFRGRISYSIGEAVDKTTGRILNNSPKHVGKLHFTVPLYKEKLLAGLELRAMSSRNTVQGGKTGGFVLANLTLLSRELIKNVELSASIYNLFDKSVHDPASEEFYQDLNPRNGRTFRLKLTSRF